MSVLPMRRGKIGVIGRVATLALLASGAGANAAEVAICSLVTKPANFDRQAVTFQGTATAVKKPPRGGVTTIRYSNCKALVTAAPLMCSCGATQISQRRSRSCRGRV